jgi:hypothetical protein
MRLRSLLLIAPLFAVACSAGGASSSSDEAAVQVAPDISHTAFVESGRLAPDASLTADATLDGKVRAYRFNGFGKTKVKITVASSDFAPSLTIDGPIAGPDGQEGHVVAFKIGKTGTASTTFETTLDAPGAYRVLVGSRAMLGGSAATGKVHVDFACEDNCDLPEISLADVLRDLQGKVGKEALGTAVGQWLDANVTDSDLRKTIADQFADVTKSDIPDDLVAPILPMSLLRVGQGLFEQDKKAAVPAPTTQSFDLSALLRDCAVTRAARKPVNAALPGLEEGDFPDYTYDDCSLARAEAFASVLDNLAMDNGSVVVDGDKKYTTIEDTLRALVASGHRIRVDNARYFADFLGLAYNGASVKAPVWVDTQIPMPDGGTLKIPAPHAHHNIYVSGPILNAHLKFYMGIDSGTAFRVQSTIMRHWSGGHPMYTYDTNDDADKVVSLLSLGGKLRKKWILAGEDKPALGYGTIGVCTDSTAILEYATEGTITLFPLAHPKTDAAADDIDAILAKLPADVEGFDPADGLSRIKTSLPFASIDDVPFKPFVASMKKL